MNSVGKVYLVGAGPGDPGLITLRGAECLGLADVVLYDYLASPLLLAHAGAGAELVCLGRHGHGRLMTPAEVVEAMLAHARGGRVVVRLKGGDPTIFARMSEEVAALDAAGVPYEIVPGVTAAQAASSHAGIPLTHRDHASCVALVAGQESPDKGAAEQLDYAALAKFPGTLVYYMGITTSGDWSARLIQKGKSAETPVAVVRRCSFPDQQTIFTTLGQLPEALARGGEKLRPPAIVIVGEVARESASSNWFTSRPLFGRTVLVTRPAEEGGSLPSAGDELSTKLRDLGANVLHQPAITVRETSDWSPVDQAIGRLDEFDWLVFTSANGVNYFLLRLFLLGHDTRSLGHLKLAVVGAATEEELLQYFLTADVCPSVARAESLAEELAPHASGKRFLLARGSRGREVLAQQLTASGGHVEQVVVYESVDVTQVDESIAAAMSAGKIQWTTVTSSAIARNLVRLFGKSLQNTRLVAISPLTAEALYELGYEPAVVADDYNAQGIVDAILASEVT
jgi:uroporphyrinogen III methyltransferase/synthase